MIKGINKFIDDSIEMINKYFYTNINDKSLDFDNIYEFQYCENLQKKCKQDNCSVDLNIHKYLGELYSSKLTNEEKKDFGQFYTNNRSIIKLMLDEIDVLCGKILEPSCGSGQFIVEIINKIISIKKQNGESIENILEYIVENIYCNDVDINALKIVEINIISVLLPYMIYVKNRNNDFKLKRLKIYNYDFVNKDVLNEKFDLVIGNPPFVTMYGKRSRNMTEEKRNIYNKFNFVTNKNGNNKFNLSMFFIENGLEALVKNGNLIYILDISFFEMAFQDIRKFLINNFDIKLLISGIKVFESVASGQIILKVTNSKTVDNVINLINFNDNIKLSINQKEWNNEKDQYKFRFPLNNIEEVIIKKIEKYKKIDVYFPNKEIRTCCALTGRTEDFLTNEEVENEDIFPYLEGSKGLKEKFAKLNYKNKIKYDYDLQIKISNEFKKELELKGVKNKKRVTLGDKDTYIFPKIFVRQSSKELVATYTEEKFAANNSIYIISKKSNDIETKKILKYVCGIINSDLLSFYARIKKIIRYEVGKTPQIKISDFKELRINIDDKFYDIIIDLVDGILIKKEDLKIQMLNDYVYKIYGIDDVERKYIENYLIENR